MKLSTLLLFPLLAFSFAGAGPAAIKQVTIKHAAGEVALTAPAKRVVALGPHALDLLLSLGVQPVGYGEAAQLGVTNYGSPVRQIRYLGSRITGRPLNVGDRFKPNLEVIAALKPDLIVGENYAQEAYPALSKIAPTLLFEGIHTGDWQKSLPALAKAVGGETQVGHVLTRRQQGLSRTRQQLPAWPRGKKVLVVWNAGGANRDLFTVLGPRDWTGGFVQGLGFRLELPGEPDSNLGEGYRKISSEGLATTDADAIFVIASSKNTVEQARKDWQANVLAQRLRGSKAGQVYFLDIQLFGRIRGPIAEELMERELLRQFKK